MFYDVLYIAMLIAGLFLLFSPKILKKKRKKRKVKKEFEINRDIVQFLDSIIERQKFLMLFRDRLASKLNVVNMKTKKHNEALATLIIGGLFLEFIVIFLAFIRLFTMWYVAFFLTLLATYLTIFAILFYLNNKLAKIYRQFPVAIQQFTDEYITSKNIKTAFNNIYLDLPKESSLIFEKLSRNLASNEFEKSIEDFAKNLNYVWGYAFAELLLLSYKGGGDITDDLIFLEELVNEDIKASAETKSKMAMNRAIFLILSLATLLTFIVNIFICPIGKTIYFYTVVGNSIILGWILIFAAGVLTATLMENI